MNRAYIDGIASAAAGILVLFVIMFGVYKGINYSKNTNIFTKDIDFEAVESVDQAYWLYTGKDETETDILKYSIINHFKTDYNLYITFEIQDGKLKYNYTYPLKINNMYVDDNKLFHYITSTDNIHFDEYLGELISTDKCVSVYKIWPTYNVYVSMSNSSDKYQICNSFSEIP